RVGAAEGADDADQDVVLAVRIGQGIAAFQLDDDGEIVAGGAPAPAGLAGMPGAPAEGDVLDELAVASDDEMRRDFEPAQALKIRMGVMIEGVGEQLVDVRTAELGGRQTDAMNDKQVH